MADSNVNMVSFVEQEVDTGGEDTVPECSTAMEEDGQQRTEQVHFRAEPHFEQVTAERLEDADCSTVNDKLNILPPICSTTGQINATQMAADCSTVVTTINDDDDDDDDDSCQQPAGQFLQVFIKEEIHSDQEAEECSEEQDHSTTVAADEPTPECSDAMSPIEPIEQDGEDGQQCAAEFCQVIIKQEPHFEQEADDCSPVNGNPDMIPPICSTTGQINATQMTTDGQNPLPDCNDDDDDDDDEGPQPAGQFLQVLIDQGTQWEPEAEEYSEEQDYITLSNYKTSGIQNMGRDVIKHTGEKPFWCDLCDYKTLHRSHLKVHLRTHTKEKPFSCEFCNYACIDAGKLKVHMRKHTGEKPYSCEICDFKCSQLSNLKGHRRTHSDKKHFSCELCDYTCARSCSLKNHLYKTHNIGKELIKCEYCDYTSSQSSDLKVHMRTHTGEKPYSCELCSYSCSQSGRMVFHMRTHTGEKPYSCEFCSFSCTQPSGLKSHIMKIHTGKKKFNCEFCDFKTARSNVMRCHRRKHTGKKATDAQTTNNEKAS